MRPSQRVRDEIGRILRLGLPIGGILGLETGVFSATGVLMGLLGADALGAHQLVMNCISVIFMVPLGISQAVTVRVAVALGSGMPAAARRAAIVALVLGVAYMTVMAVVLVAAPRAIARIYIDIDAPTNQELVGIALYLLVIAAVFQIFDGMQAIAGALRGYRDTAIPLLLAVVGYWGVGFYRRLAARRRRRLRSTRSLVRLSGGSGCGGADADSSAVCVRWRRDHAWAGALCGAGIFVIKALL